MEDAGPAKGSEGVETKREGEELCVEFDYVWPLNIGVLQAEGPKEPIACPEFSTTHRSVSYKWQLLLYLSRPLSEFGEKYMGLYLCYKTGPMDFVALDCEMFVLGLDHSRVCRNLTRGVELEMEGRAWGYANFCPQDLPYLQRSSNAALIGAEKELRIGVTLRISVDYFNLHNFFAQLSAGKEAERLSAYLFEKVCLDFEFGAERADCRLVANDGAGFFANRAVLEYASPVLRSLLQKTNPFLGKDNNAYNEITVDDLSSPALREILHYVYKGIVSEHLPAIAIEVVHGAHNFQLPALKSLCEKAMVYQLTEKNAVKYLYTAETYGLPVLANMALNTVLDRWPLIHNSKEAQVLVMDKTLVKKMMDGSSARVNCHLNLVKTERKVLPATPTAAEKILLQGTDPFGLPYANPTAEEAYARAMALAGQHSSLRRGLSQPHLHTQEPQLPQRGFSPRQPVPAHPPSARHHHAHYPPAHSPQHLPQGMAQQGHSTLPSQRRSQSLSRHPEQDRASSIYAPPSHGGKGAGTSGLKGDFNPTKNGLANGHGQHGQASQHYSSLRHSRPAGGQHRMHSSAHFSNFDKL